jgi:8-oxo-dGTP pyrophosphatase MutT (NUDIX family)/GNAT superfamily N-acetyltransferase
MRAREFTEPSAAGCILRASDTGRYCLQQRSDSVSDPGVWSTWGGGRESGESLEQCVHRELAEEGGYTGPLKLEPLSMNSRYATYIGHVPHEFEPNINNEVKDWCWVELDDLPHPLYPGLVSALKNVLIKEDFSNDMSIQDMIAYLRQHHDKNLHPDYVNHLTTTNSKFVLKNIPLTSIRTELAGLDRAKVEQYKQMDFGKAPPIVVGSDGNILDGYHRATVAKALGIPTIKAYVGVKDQQGVAENFADGQSKKISFNTQKGNNKFVTTMTVDNEPVGVYQYDADTGRSIAEIYPEYKGQGLGKLLVLNAIYTAAKLGLDFVEDESRTAEYDNVLDSLSGNGYIVDDDGYWYVTDQGEQYLKQSLKQGVAENFADGKNPGRKGLSRRVGIPKKASLTQLQKIASSSTGERRRMAQWQLNMRRGKARKNK